MREVTKKYSNGEITVIWQNVKCIHSANCIRGLPEVFNHQMRPWINMDKSTTEKIKRQVEHCPSGALSYIVNNNINQNQNTVETNDVKVKIMANGPLLVEGKIKIIDKEGNESEREGTTALCRCGQSKNKPFCDGTHRTEKFDV